MVRYGKISHFLSVSFCLIMFVSLVFRLNCLFASLFISSFVLRNLLFICTSQFAVFVFPSARSLWMISIHLFGYQLVYFFDYVCSIVCFPFFPLLVQFIYDFLFLFVSLSPCLFDCLSVCVGLSVCRFVCLIVRLSTRSFRIYSLSLLAFSVVSFGQFCFLLHSYIYLFL